MEESLVNRLAEGTAGREDLREGRNDRQENDIVPGELVNV
jgi:hypothetical protein